jgi:hypothetical protein
VLIFTFGQKQYLMLNKWTNMPELPVFFDRYIKRVEDMPVMEAFRLNNPTDIMSDMVKLKALKDNVYAPEKWTIKDILQHIIDTERILTYRALRFARNDKTILPGFEENDFAKNTKVNYRTIEQLMEEWNALRVSTIAMFKSFDNEMFNRKGTAFQSEISVLALAFVIIGHPKHHYKVIQDKYFPLLDK